MDNKYIDLFFIYNQDKQFLEKGDTLKIPSRFSCFPNRIAKYIGNNFVEVDGKKFELLSLSDLMLTKETKIKTLSKQIELMESQVKAKKDLLEEVKNWKSI